MIHINTGNGKHEWLTPEEYAGKFITRGAVSPEDADRGQKLRIKRLRERITAREMATRLTTVNGYKWTPGDVSDVETGRRRVTDDLTRAWIAALHNGANP